MSRTLPIATLSAWLLVSSPLADVGNAEGPPIADTGAEETQQPVADPATPAAPPGGQVAAVARSDPGLLVILGVPFLGGWVLMAVLWIILRRPKQHVTT